MQSDSWRNDVMSKEKRNWEESGEEEEEEEDERGMRTATQGGQSYRLTFCCACDCFVSLHLLPSVLLYTLTHARALTHLCLLSHRIELISFCQLTSEDAAGAILYLNSARRPVLLHERQKKKKKMKFRAGFAHILSRRQMKKEFRKSPLNMCLRMWNVREANWSVKVKLN